MDEEQTQIPQLIDSEHIMALTNIIGAKKLLGGAFKELVIISRWMPWDGQELGIVLGDKHKRTKQIPRDKLLQPVIKDVTVTWGYSQEKIEFALKILSLMGWQHPEFYCAKTEYPLMIRCGKRHNDETKESVILIAPRCQA